jgi:uncharacterized membrane protein YbhN (UPF0104 family)
VSSDLRSGPSVERRSRRGGGPSTDAISSSEDEWIGPVHLGPLQVFARRHRRVITLVVFITSVLACVALSAIAGWHATAARLEHLSWWWLPVILVAHAVAYASYVVAHRNVVDRSFATSVGWRRGAQVVVIGFGAWLTGGGFAVDRHALEWFGLTSTDASISAIALGALELALLTPAAWLCALLLLGTAGVPESATLPWVIGVPLGMALAIALAVRGLRMTVDEDETGFVRARLVLMVGLARALTLLRRPRWGSMAGGAIASYWAADIAALWAALQFFSTAISPPRLILAYATGYLLTRRSLPFAGVVITEVLMAVSLLWVGIPLAAAAPAVLVYRLSDFPLTLGAALLSSSALERNLALAPANARVDLRVDTPDA